ncbi:hypothetical protein V6N13_006074 [Hibiscus sabdariffa]
MLRAMVAPVVVQYTAPASALNDQTTTTSVVVLAASLQSVVTATTAKAVNTDDVLIAAEPITTISTKEIGTMTTTILDLDEEMGHTFLPKPTMLFEFDE